MIKHCLAGLLLLFGTLGSTPRARALPEYPDDLHDAVPTPCVPHCNVCHRDDNAGSGTVDRPFGLSMRQVGGLGGGGVARAVERLRAANTDSDGDGVSDIDELEQGEDPNYAGNGDLCGPEVGCSAAPKRTRQQGSSGWSGLLAPTLMLFVLLRRSRRRVL